MKALLRLPEWAFCLCECADRPAWLVDSLKALVWLAREISVKAWVGIGSLFPKQPQGQTEPGNDPTFYPGSVSEDSGFDIYQSGRGEEVNPTWSDRLPTLA